MVFYLLQQSVIFPVTSCISVNSVVSNLRSVNPDIRPLHWWYYHLWQVLPTSFLPRAVTIAVGWFVGCTCKIAVSGIPNLLNNCAVYILGQYIIYICRHGPWVGCPWSWKHCLQMLTWNIEEEQIPFPPMVSISLIFTPWRKVSIGCNLIHLLLFSHLCSVWKQSCTSCARSTYVPVCASACPKASYFITYHKCFPLSFI